MMMMSPMMVVLDIDLVIRMKTMLTCFVAAWNTAMVQYDGVDGGVANG